MPLRNLATLTANLGVLSENITDFTGFPGVVYKWAYSGAVFSATKLSVMIVLLQLAPVHTKTRILYNLLQKDGRVTQ
jgi:hypothetical protein